MFTVKLGSILLATFLVAEVQVEAKPVASTLNTACEQALQDLGDLARVTKIHSRRYSGGPTQSPPRLSTNEIFASLLTAKDFRDHVRTESNWWRIANSGAERERVASSYGKRLIEYYEGENLERLQSESLRRELAIRGFQSNSPGRSALRELSEANLARYLESFPPKGSHDTQIENLVDSIRIYFVHNTHVINRIQAFPIMSSHELEKRGFNGGLNTRPFNSQILQSNRNVFFKFYIVGPKGHFKPPFTPYGDEALFLDSDFAREQAWISPDIMIPAELSMALYGDISERGSVHQLHKFDFTVEDFINLVKSNLEY